MLSTLNALSRRSYFLPLAKTPTIRRTISAHRGCLFYSFSAREYFQCFQFALRELCKPSTCGTTKRPRISARQTSPSLQEAWIQSSTSPNGILQVGNEGAQVSHKRLPVEIREADNLGGQGAHQCGRGINPHEAPVGI